jgi:hypothetical protein
VANRQLPVSQRPTVPGSTARCECRIKEGTARRCVECSSQGAPAPGGRAGTLTLGTGHRADGAGAGPNVHDRRRLEPGHPDVRALPHRLVEHTLDTVVHDRPLPAVHCRPGRDRRPAGGAPARLRAAGLQCSGLQHQGMQKPAEALMGSTRLCTRTPAGQSLQYPAAQSTCSQAPGGSNGGMNQQVLPRLLQLHEIGAIEAVQCHGARSRGDCVEIAGDAAAHATQRVSTFQCAGQNWTRGKRRKTPSAPCRPCRTRQHQMVAHRATLLSRFASTLAASCWAMVLLCAGCQG